MWALVIRSGADPVKLGTVNHPELHTHYYLSLQPYPPIASLHYLPCRIKTRLNQVYTDFIWPFRIWHPTKYRALTRRKVSPYQNNFLSFSTFPVNSYHTYYLMAMAIVFACKWSKIVTISPNHKRKVKWELVVSTHFFQIETNLQGASDT